MKTISFGMLNILLAGPIAAQSQDPDRVSDWRQSHFAEFNAMNRHDHQEYLRETSINRIPLSMRKTQPQQPSSTASPYLLTAQAQSQLDSLYSASVLEDRELAACIATDSTGQITAFKSVNVQSNRNTILESLVLLCPPTQWNGNVHTHLPLVEGTELFAADSFSLADINANIRERRDYGGKGVFCIISAPGNARCSEGFNQGYAITWPSGSYAER